jgi:hypothetical protein
MCHSLRRARRRERVEPGIRRARGEAAPDGLLGDRRQVQARPLGFCRQIVWQIHVQPSHTTHYTHVGGEFDVLIARWQSRPRRRPFTHMREGSGENASQRSEWAIRVARELSGADPCAAWALGPT